MTLGDILVLGVLGLIVGAVVGNLFRKKKTGGCCGCASCEGCTASCSCKIKSK